jgi:hypothetical protein
MAIVMREMFAKKKYVMGNLRRERFSHTANTNNIRNKWDELKREIFC